jgi:predicted GIY-YIG superfamily endonuclease
LNRRTFPKNFVAAKKPDYLGGMAAGQQFLFAPEKPLVQRLGKKFFRKIPRQAGVYKMRDARDNIVYVGKAKDLRQRLQSYRVAHPGRMPRRHLRMLRMVARIEFDLCHDEANALKHEAKLIRELKPKFNRAGVWQGRPQFLAWRFAEHILEFAVQETPLAGWERFGPLGGHAPRLRTALIRLLWLAANPAAGFSNLPHGWAQGRPGESARIDCGALAGEMRAALENAFWGAPEMFLIWLTGRLNSGRAAFERQAVFGEVETLQEFFKSPRWGKTAGQMALL